MEAPGNETNSLKVALSLTRMALALVDRLDAPSSAARHLRAAVGALTSEGAAQDRDEPDKLT